MRNSRIKNFVLLLGFLLPTVWCGANGTLFFDGLSHIEIKEGVVQGAPRGSTIQAFINGHTLTVAFSENVGEVAIEITTVAGGLVENLWVHSPNGLQTNLPLVGEIANVYGVVMATFELLGDEEQKVLDLRSLASGVYTLTLYCGKLSQSCKLVIVK